GSRDAVLSLPTRRSSDLLRFSASVVEVAGIPASRGQLHPEDRTVECGGSSPPLLLQLSSHSGEMRGRRLWLKCRGAGIHPHQCCPQSARRSSVPSHQALASPTDQAAFRRSWSLF